MALGPYQFLILALGLVLTLSVMGVALYPWAYESYIKETGLKRFEQSFGFRSGVVAERSASNDAELWGIVSVVADGPFARAGVRRGDVPSDHHNGVVQFYGALREASSGHAASFRVFNASEGPPGAAVVREITLPPIK